MRWYVTSKKSNDTRDGRSLDTAFRRILHAIHMAGPDDTIVIEPGVYDQDLAKRIGAAGEHTSILAAISLSRLSPRSLASQ